MNYSSFTLGFFSYDFVFVVPLMVGYLNALSFTEESVKERERERGGTEGAGNRQ